MLTVVSAAIFRFLVSIHIPASSIDAMRDACLLSFAGPLYIVALDRYMGSLGLCNYILS